VKRLCCGFLCAALLGAAQADDAPAAYTPAAARPALEILPQRLGYAFEQPDVLLRQRLFGLAHGLSLLAASCLDLPEHSRSIQEAYAAWHARQGKVIGVLVRDLARHYFGPRAEEAGWPDLARALNLHDSIGPALGEVSLEEACASLPTAIIRPRYEFDRLLAEATAPAGADTSPRSGIPGTQSAPAPTPERLAE
jgi:hypothetical protein